MIGENKQIKAKISAKALIPLYLAVPMFYFLPVGVPTIVSTVKHRVKNAAIDAVKNAAGLSSADFDVPDITGQATSAIDEISGGCLSSVGNFIRSFLLVMTVLIAAIWVIWCIVMTIKHFQNSLSINYDDVYCSSGGNNLSTTLYEIDNVFTEQSIWGKLFDYGNITIAASNGSITVRNIAHPADIESILKSKIR